MTAAQGLSISYFYDMALPSPYAAGIQIFNTCRALCELGADVTIYGGRWAAESPEKCLAFYGLPPHSKLRIVPFFGSRWQYFLVGRKLDDFLSRLSPTPRHFIISRGEPGLLVFNSLSRRRGQAPCKYIYEAHRLCYWTVRERLQFPASRYRRWRIRQKSAQVRKQEQAALEQSDGVVCLTKGVREALLAEFTLTCPTLILPSGTAVPAHHQPPSVAKDIDILYAGKLEQRKGVADLVGAMQFMPDYRLWIVGGTPVQVRDLQSLSRKCGVAQQVTLVGFVAPAEMPAFYQRTRVGVCPLPMGTSMVSDHFTSPLKILEMMAWAVPIVATDVPSVCELLTDGETALLAKPNNPSALALAIRRLLEEPALANRLASAARRHVENYSWQQRARRLLEFLCSVHDRS